MATETYENLQFNDEKIRLTMLTNVCRMFVTRGYMDQRKYGSFDKERKVGKISVEQASETDHINNSLFLPFI
jgi:hypothetical protein